MKVITQEAAFPPISIVLESQDEVNWMHEIVSRVAGVGNVREFFDSIEKELDVVSEIWARDYNQVFNEDASVELK